MASVGCSAGGAVVGVADGPQAASSMLATINNEAAKNKRLDIFSSFRKFGTES
jgi:hypothetical protein